MKGKYAKRAEIRRDTNALEERALAAEHERDQLKGKLESLTAKHASITGTLRADLASTRKQRDEAASPLLTASEDRVRQLLDELAETRDAQKHLQETHNKLILVLHAWIMEAVGCTGTEALEMTLQVMGDNPKTYVGQGTGIPETFMQGRYEDPELVAKVRAIQRARGVRRSGQIHLEQDAS